MTIEIGSIVRLSGGRRRMTVVAIRMRPNGEVTPESKGSCPICGPYPRLESSDGQVMATMLLAQQQWRARHDAHVKLDSHTDIECCWTVEGKVERETFPIEALREITDDEADDTPQWRHRRIRRYRIREED